MSNQNITDTLDPKKVELINNFTNLAKGKSMEDMLPLLLAVSGKAKKEGISFSPEETNALIDLLKQDMSPEQQAKLEVFVQMFKLT